MKPTHNSYLIGLVHVSFITLLFFQGSISQENFTFSINKKAIGIIIVDDTLPIASGFVTGNPDLVVTCYHAELYNPGPKEFLSGNDKRYDLNFIDHSESGDIAIYRASMPITDSFLSINPRYNWKVNQSIAFLGFDVKDSYGDNLTIKVHASTIEAMGIVNMSHINTKFIEFKSEGRPGYSGGPVFNSDGQVVGIFSQSYTRQGLKLNSRKVLINRAFTIKPIIKLLD